MPTANFPLDVDLDWLGCEAMLSIPGFALLGSLAAALGAEPGRAGEAEPAASPEGSGTPDSASLDP